MKNSLNTKFLNLLVNDIFFSKNILKKYKFNTNPFFSCFEKKLKYNLTEIKDQRCLGYIRASIDKYDGDANYIKELREQGNLKARLIKNYDLKDELIIINTAGGLTSGDLNINSIKISENVNLSITSQSMEKIYFCKNLPALSYTNLSIGANSFVSWMPLETIFFNGGNLRRRVNIDLTKGSNFLGVDSIIFGRKAMGETVKKGSLDDAWQIHQNDKLLYSDFNRIKGNINKKLSNNIIMKGNNILCNIVYFGKKIKFYKRKILNYTMSTNYIVGVSIVNGILLMKILAKDVKEIRFFLYNLLKIFDNKFNLPKIWNF